MSRRIAHGSEVDMECKYKKLLNKADAECNVPRCDMCWYKEKYDDLSIEARIIQKETECKEWE